MFSVQLDSYFSAGATILVYHLGFAPLRGLSVANLVHILKNLPSKENFINSDKNPLFEKSKCRLIR